MKVVFTDDDIEEMKNIVNSIELKTFLLEECSNIAVATIILQTLFDKVNELENS